MKIACFALVVLLSGWAHASEWQELPSAVISEKVLGGTVLMLKMKYTLVINGDEQNAIIMELGDNKQKDFFKKMVMDTAPDSLRKEFAETGRPVTTATIANYELTLSGQSKQTLK